MLGKIGKYELLEEIKLSTKIVVRASRLPSSTTTSLGRRDARTTIIRKPGGEPEIGKGGMAYVYRASADVYAWARVVGFMLTGRTGSEKTLAVEAPWREILAPCVDYHPEKRPTVSALLAELG